MRSFVYRISAVQDNQDVEEVYRDILIQENKTFEDFHHAILDAFGLAEGEMASFYTCTENWEEGLEITLADMGTMEHESVNILMQEFTSFSLEENYVFYVQIRNAESGLIEFIGSSSSILQEDLPENPSIIWIPQNEGLFFIETYLWNTDNVTLSSPGEILLVNINSV